MQCQTSRTSSHERGGNPARIVRGGIRERVRVRSPRGLRHQPTGRLTLQTSSYVQPIQGVVRGRENPRIRTLHTHGRQGGVAPHRGRMGRGHLH